MATLPGLGLEEAQAFSGGSRNHQLLQKSREAPAGLSDSLNSVWFPTPPESILFIGGQELPCPVAQAIT